MGTILLQSQELDSANNPTYQGHRFSPRASRMEFSSASTLMLPSETHVRLLTYENEGNKLVVLRC